MSWPQIGEYTENGITIRRFRHAWAELPLSLDHLGALLPKMELNMTTKKKPMPAGRPVKWKTPEGMRVAIDEYFDDCESGQLVGDEIKPKHPTVTGLALWLNLTRQGLLEYCEKTDEFSDTIKKAKARVEAYIEQRLYDSNATGCIFNLKNNFGWRDAQDINHGGQKDNPLKFATPNDDEIIKRYQESEQKK